MRCRIIGAQAGDIQPGWRPVELEARGRGREVRQGQRSEARSAKSDHQWPIVLPPSFHSATPLNFGWVRVHMRTLLPALLSLAVAMRPSSG